MKAYETVGSTLGGQAGSTPPGVEYCSLRAAPRRWTLQGTVVRRAEVGPAILSHTIETDPRCRTKKVTVEEAFREETRALRIDVRGARWLISGKEDGRLLGCTDVDLQASQATYTRPIKRTRLKVGSRVDLTARWARFPGLDVAHSARAARGRGGGCSETGAPGGPARNWRSIRSG